MKLKIAIMFAMILLGMPIAFSLTAEAGSDQTACVGYPVIFNGVFSKGNIVNYFWNFGDGHSAEGVIVSHTYTSTGTYNVELTVTDVNGITATDSARVTVIDVPTGCNFCGAQLTLSKNVACGNDTIIAQITGLKNCTGSTVELKIGSDVLCTTYARENYAICSFEAPDEIGEKTIDLYIDSTKIKSTKLTLNKRPPFEQCYDKYGTPVDCSDNCTDKAPQRRWKEVKSVSIPLHFSFGQIDNPILGYSNSLTCGSETYRNFTYGINCYGGTAPNGPKGPKCDCISCNDPNYVCDINSDSNYANLERWLFGNQQNYYRCVNGKIAQGCYVPNSYYSQSCISSTGCSYDTHKAIRYTYTWRINYKLATTVMSTTDYVPMFLGYNQTQTGSKTTQITGGCSGDSVCYTEVPICGDGVCDYNGGERCWNCPQDCGASADGTKPEFDGSCSLIGCSRCPTTDLTFSDVRGCIKKYKEWGEECTCSTMCASGLKCVYKEYGVGKTPKERLQEHTVVPGHCCKSNEKWNALRNRCEVKRGLIVTNVEWEFAEEQYEGLSLAPKNVWEKISPGVYLSDAFINSVKYLRQKQLWCCNFKSVADAMWLKAKITVKNEGDMQEEFELKSSPDIDIQLGTKEFSGSATILPGETKTFEFIWDCIRTYPGVCQRTIVCKSPGDCKFTNAYDAHSAFRIFIYPTYITQGENSIEGLYDSSVYCDSTTLACTNGISVRATGNIPDGFCGGVDNPLDWTIAVWPPGMPVDCNPFVKSCVNLLIGKICI